MTTPHAVTTTICSECGEPWDGHTKLAEVNLYDDDEHFIRTEQREVTLEHCIVMLKARNRGPMGPQGAAGAPGRDAEVVNG